MSESPVRHRNYRILRVSSLGHAEASQLLYRNDPALRCRSFAEQRRFWLAQKIGHGDALSRAMKSLGHEAEEVVCDLESLQCAWASERGIDVDKRNWRTQLVLEQIAEWKPDVLFLQNYDVLSSEVRRDLKVRFPFVRLLVIAQEAVIPSPKAIRELATADVLLVNSRPFLRRCHDHGLQPQLVRSCFDPGVLAELPAPSKVAALPFFDFTFVGASGSAPGYRRRCAELAELVQRTPLRLWLVDEARALEARPSKQSDSSRQRLRELAPSRCSTAVFGLDYYGVLQRSSITFNSHRDAARGGADSHRLFQATGVGTCLVTDRAIDLSELFEDGTELLTYACVDECVEKVEYLLEHEDERRAIAAAGQARTLRDHSSRRRYAEIDEIIQRALAGRQKVQRSPWRGHPRTASF